jgi:hypothetical protein
MATDKSEPRTGLIFQIGIGSIIVLGAVHTALTSYFDHIASAEEYRKVGSMKSESLVNMRADEKQRLTSGAMPIDKAMQALATKGRMNASPDIMPSASKDVAPLQGWSKLPGEVPPAMTAVPPPEPVPAPSSSASGAPSASAAPPPAPPPGSAPVPAPQRHP